MMMMQNVDVVVLLTYRYDFLITFIILQLQNLCAQVGFNTDNFVIELTFHTPQPQHLFCRPALATDNYYEIPKSDSVI